MTGAEAVLECLRREGVDLVFGYPGGAVIPLYDALPKFEIRHILTRHEQGAAFAAGGYARASGKVGVAIATSGPGATNLVTGIADAYMDSVPIVCLTGQVPRSMIGKDSFQESDITGITLPIVKHNYLVREMTELPHVIHEAFHIARSGRPGPVLVDIPKDLQILEFSGSLEVPLEALRGYVVRNEPDPLAIAAAAELLNRSERPCLYIGGGCVTSGARDELVALAEAAGIPATWTLMGKSAFPEDHPRACGMLGMHGAAYANYAITQCDLMIVCGARFDDRVTGKLATFNPEAKVIHIDIDPAELGKNRAVEVAVEANIKPALRALLPRVQRQDRKEWLAQVDGWKKRHPLVARGPKETGEIRPQLLLDKLSAATEGKAIVVADVGQHQMWAAQFYHPSEPRLFQTSGGLGAMGFSLPAAIGAQFGCPDREVWVICGDGGIQMNIQELAVASLHRLPIRIMLVNNGYLGMVRQWQELFHDRNYSETWLQTRPSDHPAGDARVIPDFVKLCDAYGIEAKRIEDAVDVEGAIEWARGVDGPALLEFVVHEEENVWPMVPAGGDTGEPLLDPAGVDA